jgi:hypothetical protein
LNNHFNSLGSLDGIKDYIPDRITDIPQEYRSAFLLSDGSRDEEIQNLRSYELEVITEVEDLRVAAIARSTNIETYLFQLHGEQKLLYTTHQAVMAMAQETIDDPPKFGHSLLPSPNPSFPQLKKPLASSKTRSPLHSSTMTRSHTIVTS